MTEEAAMGAADEAAALLTLTEEATTGATDAALELLTTTTAELETVVCTVASEETVTLDRVTDSAEEVRATAEEDTAETVVGAWI